jgi:2-dehydro-3-deoxyphosphogluconate aldolase / (4S)-4-hydroxy-2-oxoglutarate aldolase
MKPAVQQDVLAYLERVKIVSILRGNFGDAWLDLGAALIEGGISAIEVTMNSEGALDGIQRLRNRYGDSAAIGAGTVLTPDEVDQVVEAGAQYVVAPNTNPDVITRCLEHGVLAIPGAFTATEIEFAHRLGAGLIKVFPAMPIGPSYFQALRGPYPHIPMMATGGIGIGNIKDFLDAGCNAVGLSGALVGKDVMQPGGLEKVKEKAQRISALVHG